MAEKKMTERMAATKKNAELDRLLATIRRLPDAELQAMQAEINELLQTRGMKTKKSHTPHMR